jgi:hypothetical protein
MASLRSLRRTSNSTSPPATDPGSRPFRCDGLAAGGSARGIRSCIVSGGESSEAALGFATGRSSVRCSRHERQVPAIPAVLSGAKPHLRCPRGPGRPGLLLDPLPCQQDDHGVLAFLHVHAADLTASSIRLELFLPRAPESQIRLSRQALRFRDVPPFAVNSSRSVAERLRLLHRRLELRHPVTR